MNEQKTQTKPTTTLIKQYIVTGDVWLTDIIEPQPSSMGNRTPIIQLYNATYITRGNDKSCRAPEYKRTVPQTNNDEVTVYVTSWATHPLHDGLCVYQQNEHGKQTPITLTNEIPRGMRVRLEVDVYERQHPLQNMPVRTDCIVRTITNFPSEKAHCFSYGMKAKSVKG